MRGIMRAGCRTIFCAVILCALLIPDHSKAASAVTLTWTPPTEGVEYITGYRVRWSLAADGSGGTLIDAGDVLTLRVDGLPDAKVFFSVQAVDFLGQEGAWSAQTSRSVKPAIPATMGGLTVTRVELVRP